MSRSIIILGAGPGLGQAVARRFGSEGYEVVLVGRNRERLSQLAADLGAHFVIADLTDPSSIDPLITSIRAAVGDPEVLYHASNPGGENAGFTAATALTVEFVQRYMTHAVYSLIELVHAFLPAMLEGERGAILVAQGAAGLVGRPFMSGPGLPLAAQRNYLQSLEAEVGPRGVFVGRLYLAAAIAGTPFHANLEAGRAAGRPMPDFPTADPAELAELLWSMRLDETHEATYPNDPFTG